MTATGDSPDPLESYRAKRSLEQTPEPPGGSAPVAGRRYVMHKHAASHLHWDLRLEFDGVLMSWAVPKGASFDQADKRLAVHVEDHPIEYGEFEGIIPEGNYGAGAVAIWDKGSWVPTEDPAEGFRKGKLLFELRGYKLRGNWTLVKIKKSARDWLLIKERDGWLTPGGREVSEASVRSGLTVEELRDGIEPAARVRELLAPFTLPAAPARLDQIEAMLAETADAPFSKDGWLFELKLDGYRILASRDGDDVRLTTRSGRDASASFPEIALAVRGLPYRRFLLDGEVVAADSEGRPSFQRLQQRARFLRPMEIGRASIENPVTLYAFDLLIFEETDLRTLPVMERKAVLRRFLPPVGPIPYLDHFDREGEALFEQVRRMGLEGIVAKQSDSRYRAGRSPAWLKIRSDRTEDFVVVGYTAPKGSRAGFGALHVADWLDGALCYAGRVGSGFDQALLDDLRAQLEPLAQDTPACGGPVPVDSTTTWVAPELVCEVRFKEWTDEPLLRQPVFLRLRDDKPPAECIRSDRTLVEVEVTNEPDRPVSKDVRFSNLEKLFWREEGYSKGDLVEYYRSIAPWLLPWLQDRPVVLTRYPDGIEGKSFFQKDAPKFIPEWLRTERMWSAHAKRDIDYFICDDLPSLLYLANMATIPLHVWASRVARLEQPDWCVLDLDPKGAPLTQVVDVALAVRALCEEIGLPCYVKTTGSSGLHVLLPLAGLFSYDQGRSFGELLSRVIVAEHREIATITRNIEKRDGKVYLDFVQNGHGRLLVSPYSVRPLPAAPVSMPLTWDEVTHALDLKDYTIRNAPDRMRTMGDPCLPVLDDRPDLMSVLEKLQARLTD